MTTNYHDFIRESNRIEGIIRDPSNAEFEECMRFVNLDGVTLRDMEQFVRTYQPDAELRSRTGLDVRVGNYYPPKGCITIKTRLADILLEANLNRGNKKQAYHTYQKYEHLHPFTDGNGRSGRMLWLWVMKDAPLGFLHTWHYQSLENYHANS